MLISIKFRLNCQNVIVFYIFIKSILLYIYIYILSICISDFLYCIDFTNKKEGKEIQCLRKPVNAKAVSGRQSLPPHFFFCQYNTSNHTTNALNLKGNNKKRIFWIIYLSYYFFLQLPLSNRNILFSLPL